MTIAELRNWAAHIIAANRRAYVDADTLRVAHGILRAFDAPEPRPSSRPSIDELQQVIRNTCQRQVETTQAGQLLQRYNADAIKALLDCIANNVTVIVNDKFEEP